MEDPARVKALARLHLQTPSPDGNFHRFTRLAREFLKAPVSMIALVGEKHQTLQAYETAEEEPPFPIDPDLGLELNRIVVEQGHPLILEDPTAVRAARGENNSISLIEAYAGYPICTPDGFVIGVFCILSPTPQRWQSQELELLHDLNQLVQSEIARIQQRVVNEAALQASEDRLAKVLGWADCLVWEAEVDCDSEHWDWHFNIQPSGLSQRLFGSRVLASSEGLYYKLHLPDQPDMDRRCREAILGGAPGYQQEFRIINQDGSETWLSESVTISALGNKRYWLVGVATDITLRKRLEQEMTRARDKAVEASRLKSQFLANMSHEIRTPMNGIIGMTDVLLATELSDQQKQMTEVIRQSSDALLLIINDVLDLSKIEAGMLKIERAPVALRDLLQEVTELFAQPARAKGLDLDCHIDSAVPDTVPSDSLRLRQILSNLIGNAIKFTETGRVAVDLRISTAPRQIRITVSDTGPGIPAAEQDRLFTPFVQVDGSFTRRHGGTGLGLAISRELAELMGGTITLKSQPGEGAAFTIELPVELPAAESPAEPVVPPSPPPVAPATAAAPEPTAAETAPVATPENTASTDLARVLLVEDNVTNQLVASLQLQRMRVGFAIANHGEEALEILARETFDAVLMDCQMPVLDGYTATQRIRAGEVAGLDVNIPVIALTAHAMVGDRDRCLAAGMNDYVAKPITMRSLQVALKNCGVLRSEDAPLRPRTPAAAATRPLNLQPSVIAEYRELPGEHHPSLLEDLLHEFCDNAPAEMKKLRKHVERNEPAEAARQAFEVAGLCANLGANEGRNTLLAMSESLRHGDPSTALAQLNACAPLITEIAAEAQQLLDKLGHEKPTT
ncbi:GAF domain-containing hybrid sensor histidine kinase/response regulator [Actomonas aquatica]|uniref:histidine kinase n=1 Tax=Actomonas aquatica TaxID=2866162 RepID=A0ABZ1CDY3_9BACT|nr:ATP-binding protein [Opitutus sp. WL0086]WRQ89627.1 ATP-binding protein [Opitutus sp. WL0086]